MPTKFPFIANEFNGKRVLVTGGTAGIGKAVVTRVLDGGAKVITTARKVAKDEEKENPELKFVQADLSTSEGCTKVVNEVISQFGGVDILVSVVGASSAPSGGFWNSSNFRIKSSICSTSFLLLKVSQSRQHKLLDSLL
jgi:NAD(P)-dependent dehydrogenase (short-subunit alcohol dehydrogenase family)